MTQIKFGTSGWRGIFCEDFTLDNVRVVTQAIADHLRAEGLADKAMLIGYDARFMGADFARESARVLAGAGIKSFLCNRDTPTPVISHELLRRGTAGAINLPPVTTPITITASNSHRLGAVRHCRRPPATLKNALTRCSARWCLWN